MDTEARGTTEVRGCPWLSVAKSHLPRFGKGLGRAWLFALIVLIVFLSSARAANEAALLELWQQHLASPDDHDAVIKACESFSIANPGDPLLPVVRGIEGWHHFRAGRTPDGLRMIEPYLSASPGPVTDSARVLTQGWLTRLDREKVATALQLYYRKEIAYPKTLEQLAKHPKIPADAQPPFNDRFGKPWTYRLIGFGKVAGFTDQKYSLQSAVLGDFSEFKAALQIPYASRIVATPAQVVAVPGSTVAAKFNLPGKSAAVVGLGQATGDLHLAFVGSQIIVVCDYTHWKVFPKP